MPDAGLTAGIAIPTLKLPSGTMTLTIENNSKPPADPIADLYSTSREAEELDDPTRQQIERFARQIAFGGEDGDTETEFNRIFDYSWRDGAYATMRVIDEFFGVSLGRGIETMFGEEPPRMIDIDVGVDETVQVPWGKLEIPSLDRAELMTSAHGGKLRLAIKARRKHREKVEAFFGAIEAFLKEHSIYHGKATVGIRDPSFLDAEKIDLDAVVYSDEVQELLDGTLWSVLRHTDAMREIGLPLKRAVLLHGPYGTGKSLTGQRTARIAVENGWTFISARAGEDELSGALEMARLYTPAVVFYEDVDTETEPDDDGDEVSRLLDVFDGITAKDKEIVVVMTTNHIERIHKGMLRPGRLDALVELSALDQGGIARIIAKAVDSERLGTLDFMAIAEEMEGFTPAFVREVVTRAASVALSRNDGSVDFVLNTADLITAARSLAPQLEFMAGAKEDVMRSSLEGSMERLVRTALDGGKILDYDGDKIDEYGMKLSLKEDE